MNISRALCARFRTNMQLLRQAKEMKSCRIGIFARGTVASMPTALVARQLAAVILCCGIAGAAALVRLPNPNDLLPVADLEVNRGQAKPEVLFLSRANRVAVTARSIILYPFGVRQEFVSGNPNPTVQFLDPLPGVVNSFTGPDTGKWLTNIPRHASAQLSEVYPGIEARYVVERGGKLTLKLLLRPGADPNLIAFDLANTSSRMLSPDGSLSVRLGPLRTDQFMAYPAPVAFQPTPLRRFNRSVRFDLRSGTQFGFRVEGVDARLPLQIELKIESPENYIPQGSRHTSDEAGNRFIVATIPDAAGNEAPFPEFPGEGCSKEFAPIACTDVAIYKFSAAGELVFATYLEGATRERATFLQIATDGSVMVTGNTDSSNFPVTAAAFQADYGGPAPTYQGGNSGPVTGDFFAAKLDSRSGALRASTYLGGPEADSIGETALGPDGSLYFMPVSLGDYSAKMPVTTGALLSECSGDPCLSAYAAHLSPDLGRLLYGTYLPGIVQATARLHSDGSVYFAGSAGEHFPVTRRAYQPELAGGRDAIVARLDPSGGSLIFGTYIGGAATDMTFDIAVAPDGSVWAAVTSYVECCIDIEHRLVRLDPKGERVLADKAIYVWDLTVEPNGDLFAIVGGDIQVTAGAFLAHSCSGLGYVRLNPRGEQLFSTYLPTGASPEFQGTGENGLPILAVRDGFFRVAEEQSNVVFTGCVFDAASLGAGVLSPGAIVTLFGSRMGPLEGVAFQLGNGRVPTTLGGTRVLVNGEPIPLLFVSYWQVNRLFRPAEDRTEYSGGE